MPQKNTIKEYAPLSYYHIYFRGANKNKLFLEAADYHYFLALLKRYLSAERAVSKTGVAYPNFREDIKLISYCLMINHVHLFIYQAEDSQSIRRFMSSLMTSYSKYFNLKYHRVGSVFESRYKAKRVDDDSYLIHISRYIHMNPRNWQTYRYSSLRYIFDDSMRPNWLSPAIITDMFSSYAEYSGFLHDYQEHKEELAELKYQLADI